jgi:hypothetical protein
MLREGRFILPVRKDNGKGPYVEPAVFDAALKSVVSEFGGATVHRDVIGSWMTPEGELIQEPVIAFDVAYEPSMDNDYRFQAIAIRAANQAAQRTVYVRFPSGEVIIPDVQIHAALEEAVA